MKKLCEQSKIDKTLIKTRCTHHLEQPGKTDLDGSFFGTFLVA